jgi:hypothetical protein
VAVEVHLRRVGGLCSRNTATTLILLEFRAGAPQHVPQPWRNSTERRKEQRRVGGNIPTPLPLWLGPAGQPIRSYALDGQQAVNWHIRARAASPPAETEAKSPGRRGWGRDGHSPDGAARRHRQCDRGADRYGNAGGLTILDLIH